MTQSKATIELMRQALQEAVSTKEKLNSLDDSVSATIKSIEKALMNLKLGFRISAKQAINESDAVEYLEFQKWGNEWRLTYATSHEVFDDYSVKALSDCNRDTRARTLTELLPQLVLNVSKSLQDRIAEREQAITTGQEIRELISNLDDIPF
ncbi:MAG: hypothetical protein JKY56_13720 [Kofleriaceae bacterium]|nr:hypothetical protein [Kofleriaceae bacterium]